jgi:hypothetical protein
MPMQSLSDEHSPVTALEAVRFVASFALLGAVVAGAAIGWMDQLQFDPRLAGAILGAALGVAAKVTRFG